MLKKVMITGADGQLGRALNKVFEKKSEVQIINTDVSELDITKLENVKDFVIKKRPEIIINCAAHTAVDLCEEQEEKAYEINAVGAKNLSIAAKLVEAVLVHISTDYVFDGKKDTPYIEEDSVKPQSAYGRTKWAGEEFVRENNEKHFIVRTAWLYGDGKNFVRTMLGLAKENSEVSVVEDQFGTPTSAMEVAKVIAKLIETENYGTYHATCEGKCSWADFAEEIFRLSGCNTTVKRLRSEEFKAKAKRPMNSVLDNKKLREVLGYKMGDWHMAIEEYINFELCGRKKVLVTGANGYIGRHVVKKLLDMGHEVLASDFSFEGIDERAKLVTVPIFSGDTDIYEQFGRPDVCIHMAWRNGFVHNADSQILDLPDHYTFIKNMIEGGLSQIAVMGTMHEVGYWEGAITEDTPTNPISLYGIAKNALRQMTFSLAADRDAKVTWLRAYYILGDDKKSNSIFAKIVKWEEEGKEKFPFNSGKNKYDFISVDELATQIASAATQDKIFGIINCCTGEPISLADKVEEFIKEHNFKIRPEYGAFPDRPYDSPAIWGDSSKIKKIMNER